MTPRTKAGADLSDRAVAAWWQPEDPYADYMDPRSHSQSATTDIRAAIRAIEDEMLDKVVAAVTVLPKTSFRYDGYPSGYLAVEWPDVLAAIERIRRDDDGRS